MAEPKLSAGRAGTPSDDLVFMGPPGAGKGTQAALLKETTGWTHLSTGDLFRQHLRLGTDLGFTCLSPLAWGGFIELFERPKIDGTKLRFEIVDSNLLDVRRPTRPGNHRQRTRPVSIVPLPEQRQRRR